MPVIYKITCNTSNKMYIGQTKYTARERWSGHVEKAISNRDKQQCWALNNAIRKYGKDDFTIETIAECEESELDPLEIKNIGLYNTLYPSGYNLTKGGTFRVGPWRDESKDKLSAACRKYKTYDLPRNVVEINNPSQGGFGFRVITQSRTYTFLQSSLSMEEKLQIALDCYEKVTSGQPFIAKNRYKRTKEDLDIPMYIVRRGDHGFAVNKPGHTRKTFAHVNNTREQNLQNAINHLNSL